MMHWPENETGIASRVGNNNAALSVVVDTAGHTPAHTRTLRHFGNFIHENVKRGTSTIIKYDRQQKQKHKTKSRKRMRPTLSTSLLLLLLVLSVCRILEGCSSVTIADSNSELFNFITRFTYFIYINISLCLCISASTNE